MQSISIGADAVPASFFNPENLSSEELSQLRRLVSWEYDKDIKSYLIKRRFPHKVGRVVVGGVVYSVHPDLSPLDFTTFFLYSLGIRLDRFISKKSSELSISQENSHFDFRTMAAALLIITAEELGSGYFAKGYVEKNERLCSIKGRIDWRKVVYPTASVGIPCSFSEITQDNLLNRIVIAGLRSIQDVSLPPIYSRRLNEQIFNWSSIASHQSINLDDLVTADKAINRLTDKYRQAIGLCRMVMFGYCPDDFFSSGDGHFQCIEFDLSFIFERFVFRLLEQRLAGSGLVVEAQVRDRGGLCDGRGNTYHEVRPDYVISYNGHAVAVLDAKFKPRYVSSSDGVFCSENKVSEADIYQVLFYAQRAKQISGGSNIKVFIASPLIQASYHAFDKTSRRIIWTHEGKEEIAIDVLDVDIPATLLSLREFSALPSDGLADACNIIAKSCIAPHGDTLSPASHAVV